MLPPNCFHKLSRIVCIMMYFLEGHADQKLINSPSIYRKNKTPAENVTGGMFAEIIHRILPLTKFLIL